MKQDEINAFTAQQIALHQTGASNVPDYINRIHLKLDVIEIKLDKLLEQLEKPQSEERGLGD